MKTVVGDWEEVYSVQSVTKDTWTENLPLFHEDTTYYRTFGGGPEGGYFVKVKMSEGDNLNCASCDSVWRVRRSLYQPWTVEKLKNRVFEYEPADEMAGKTARCRLIETYSLRETREIVDTHRLWGNAIEIVKCLRDALSPVSDESYKEMCLGIILDHFTYIDKHLDLLPADSCGSYKKALNELAKQQKEKDEERESEDSGSDSE